MLDSIAKISDNAILLEHLSRRLQWFTPTLPEKNMFYMSIHLKGFNQSSSLFPI